MVKCRRKSKCDACWTGKANDVVVGVLYRIPTYQKPALDQAEGLGRGYHEATVTVIAADGTALDAIGYFASDGAKDASLKPYQWYKDFVELGAREHSLPEAYVQKFISNVDAIK